MDEAATWLARRDRGLGADEQDDYIQWLQADPRHAEALRQHAAALERMMQLYEWQPAHTLEPNPDLFAPVARRKWWAWPAGLAAAAAAVFAAALVWDKVAPATVSELPEVTKNYLRVNERIALPDGSRVELRDGSHIVVQYSNSERRVRLTTGEAHFTVWEDASRPFVVEAGGVTVQAVGTAFDVRWEHQAVEVLVTAGQVKVEPPAGEVEGIATRLVSAGQRTVVASAGGTAAPELAAPLVTPVTSEEIGRALAWQAPRLQFHETPLEEAVEHFNRLNRHQLVLGDPALNRLPIGGTFRPDNVDAFVRLLEFTLKIHAERRGDHETVLRRRP